MLQLLHADLVGLDHFAPLLDLRLDVLGELLGGLTARLGTLDADAEIDLDLETLRFEDRFTRYVSERVEPEQQDML